MDYIIGGKRTGKTTKAIQLVKDDANLLLMVRTPNNKVDLQRQYPEIKDRIVCMTDIISKKEQEVVLDEADIILNYLFRAEKGISLKVLVLDKED